jgi:predicted Rdx family selenoprotein
MVEQFETFLNFNDEDLARFVAEKLKDNNVEFIVEKSKPLLDASLVDTSIDRNIHIKLRRQDFQKGDQALEDYYKAQLTNIDSEYYLLSFSDDELKDVITKPDEWGHFNYQLAQKLLKERGHDIEESMLSKLKADRIKDLAQPEKASRLLLFFGYCFIPFGLIVGFLIGRHLFHSKKPLPNGQLVFSYTEADRKHGNRIMIITGVIFILSIVFWAIMLIKDN